MAQAVISESVQAKTVGRKYLTAEQEWVLVLQIRERTELLKCKTKGFTTEEKRIHIKGERAFNTLLDSYQKLIWSLIHRFNITERITTDEMYQAAVIAVEKAISIYDPHKFDRKPSLGGWVFCKVRFAFLCLMQSEFRYTDRSRAVCNVLKQDNRCADEQTPLKVLIQEDLRTQLDQVVSESLSGKNAQIFSAFYHEQKRMKEIADEFSLSELAVINRNLRSRIQLRANPRVRELAEAYFS